MLMVVMKKKEMTRIINEELRHITKSEDDSQAELRLLHNSVRRRDLRFGKSKEETLAYYIQRVKGENTSFRPLYNRDFFKLLLKSGLRSGEAKNWKRE